jgi:hypothetical protein
MRGNPQAASARLPARAPARRWPAWLAQAQERRRRAQIERLEVTERLRAEERRSRRSGENGPKLRPWL